MDEQGERILKNAAIRVGYNELLDENQKLKLQISDLKRALHNLLTFYCGQKCERFSGEKWHTEACEGFSKMIGGTSRPCTHRWAKVPAENLAGAKEFCGLCGEMRGPNDPCPVCQLYPGRCDTHNDK